MTYEEMLEVAINQARIGLKEGGIPIGAALFTHGFTITAQKLLRAGGTPKLVLQSLIYSTA